MDWELVFTPHVESRMEERGFSEVELRSMLESATELVSGTRAGRWVVHTRHAGRPWVVVLEPDHTDRQVFVVTACERES